jgi:hypothetical protein
MRESLLQKRKRFKNKYEWKGQVQYDPPSGSDEEDHDRDVREELSYVSTPSTWERCLMGASEALNRLTKEEDENHEDSEWLTIKLSKSKSESFMVDYCDGGRF